MNYEIWGCTAVRISASIQSTNAGKTTEPGHLQKVRQLFVNSWKWKAPDL